VIVEALFSYFLLFSIAIANFYNFVLHVFFGKMTAAFIGWEDSPFQLEVGFASLGFAALGLLAFKGSLDLRLAAIVGPACFLWGAAGGHVRGAVRDDSTRPRGVVEAGRLAPQPEPHGRISTAARQAQAEFLAGLDQRRMDHIIIFPRPEQLVARLTGHAVTKSANILPGDLERRHVEEFEFAIDHAFAPIRPKTIARPIEAWICTHNFSP